MLVVYKVVEDIYQGLYGIKEIGLFDLPDNLTKEEIEKECDKYCEPIVEDLIISHGLKEECWCGYWTCYKVRDDVKLSERALDNELSMMGFDMFANEYCIKKRI